MFVCISCDQSMVDWMEVAIAEVACGCCGVKRFCRYKEVSNEEAA